MLGPILFALYMLPLGDIISRFKGISYHMYAAVIQLSFSFDPDCTDNLNVLHDCLLAVNKWMSNNFLQLNTAKTEVLIVAPEGTARNVASCIGSLNPHEKSWCYFRSSHEF